MPTVLSLINAFSYAMLHWLWHEETPPSNKKAPQPRGGCGAVAVHMGRAGVNLAGAAFHWSTRRYGSPGRSRTCNQPLMPYKGLSYGAFGAAPRNRTANHPFTKRLLYLLS